MSKKIFDKRGLIADATDSLVFAFLSFSSCLLLLGILNSSAEASEQQTNHLVEKRQAEQAFLSYLSSSTEDGLLVQDLFLAGEFNEELQEKAKSLTEDFLTKYHTLYLSQIVVRYPSSPQDLNFIFSEKYSDSDPQLYTTFTLPSLKEGIILIEIYGRRSN